MKILFVTSDKYPPFRPAAKALFGGGIPARGHRVDWLLQADEPGTATGRQAHAGGTAYVARTTAQRTRISRILKYCFDVLNDCRAFWLLRGKQYSLVQIKDKYCTALPALLAAKLFRVPVFYWQAYPHAEAAVFAAENGIARYSLLYALRGRLQSWLLYRVLMPACDHVFVQSEQMRVDVAHHGIAAERTTAVPSSIDIAEVDRSLGRCENSLEPADSGPRLVYLGTLLRERQLSFLTLVLAHVLQRRPDVHLEFVGEGGMPADEEHILAEARRLDIEANVTITGWLPLPDAWQRVRNSRICLSPYRPIPILRSTSPTKLIEYMALGKAVVANDHPEQSVVVRQSGCGIVSPWEAGPFADAILKLLEDPELCDQMGRAGRSYVERFRTHTALSDLVLDAYGHVLQPGIAPVIRARASGDLPK
jgi:glycosyltransferase involved in cell wall biosynthesis